MNIFLNIILHLDRKYEPEAVATRNLRGVLRFGDFEGSEPTESERMRLLNAFYENFQISEVF